MVVAARWLALGAVAVGLLAACGPKDDAEFPLPAGSVYTGAPSAASTASSLAVVPAGLPTSFPALPVSSAAATVAQPEPAAGSCHATGTSPFLVPDARCDPGAVSAAVMTADVGSTVCVKTWAATVVKPSGLVLDKEFKASKAAYGSPAKGGGYALGYVVPLALGGAANDPRNTWPMTAAVSAVRRTLTARLVSHVCDGTLPLASAQSLMASDFLAAYAAYVGPTTSVGVAPGGVAVGTACSTPGAFAESNKGRLAQCAAGSSGTLRWSDAG